jgi:hypothetical protein
MASAPAGRVKKGTVPEHTVTTVTAGMPTRRSSQALLGNLGVESLFARSTSVTMGDILIKPVTGVQTLPFSKRGFLVVLEVSTCCSKRKMEFFVHRVNKRITAK